jgi:hypothetical protein
MINTAANEDGNRLGIICTNRIDRALHRGKIAAAIGSDNEALGVSYRRRGLR